MTNETSEKAGRKWFDILFKNKAGMWTAIFTGILSIFTFFLWNVAQSTDETSRSSQRAFLNFSQLGLGVNLTGPDFKAWVGQEFSLNWVNSGNTPASSIVIQANVQAWRSGLPVDYNFPENRYNTLAAIGPKGIYGTLTRVSKEDLMDTWQAKSHLFFWGSVVYKDIFPKDPDRLSEFCVEMTHVTFASPTVNQTPPQGGAVPPTTGQTLLPIGEGVVAFQWQACAEHNCYDQECKDYSERVRSARAK